MRHSYLKERKRNQKVARGSEGGKKNAVKIGRSRTSMGAKDVGIMNETNPKLENIIPKILPFSAVVYLVSLDRLQESQMKLALDLEHRERYENASPGHCRVVDSHCHVRTHFANGGARCSTGGEERFAGQDGWS